MNLRRAAAVSLLLMSVTPIASATPPATGSRKAIAASLLELWEKHPRNLDEASMRTEAETIVRSLGEEDLARVEAGETFVAKLPDRGLQLEFEQGMLRTISPLAIGDTRSDLLFVPLTPCRVFDTRTGGGAFSPGETRSFVVSGTTGFVAQGGKSGGCGVPQGSSSPLAAAAFLNFVAVGPAGQGHLVAWRTGTSAPSASVLNYAATGGLNIANGVILPIAGVSSQPSDINVQAAVSATHVLADVTGYFTTVDVDDILPHDDSIVVSLATPLTLNECNVYAACTLFGRRAGILLVQGVAQVRLDHENGTTDRVVFRVAPSASADCSVTDGSGTTDYEVPSTAPSHSSVDATVPIFYRQTVGNTANLTQYDLTLTVKLTSSAGTNDTIQSMNVQCLYIPTR